MNSPEQTQETRPVKERRVGTFTFGAVLVICGVLMLVSMFFPRLDLTLALKLSPLILVSLGVEVLLAGRRAGKRRPRRAAGKRKFSFAARRETAPSESRRRRHDVPEAREEDNIPRFPRSICPL